MAEGGGELELLPGEVINLRLERVGVFYGSTCGLEPQGGHGSLLVTNYQMSFNWGGKKPVNIPHLNFTKVTKRDRATDKRSEDWDSGGSAANPLTHKMGMVHLERRDTTPMTIILFAASTLIDAVNDELYPNPTRQCSKLFECLMSYVFPRSLTKVFAFSYRQTFEPEVDGWRVYNPDEEFARQGVLAADSGWRVSHVNHEYSACESYPRKVAVPAGIRDWEVKKALEFRGNGRFPIMVWKNPRGHSVICRSAQPLPGLFRMRNKEDERLVALIRAANPSPTPLYIIDARPHTNAQANTVFRAAGYERGSYEKCEIVFLGIENIHAVRKSYMRLRELCTSAPIDDDERWLHYVQETYWLQHISKLLQGSRRIAELVMLERASVLIHCSDGWDRTPQISALAQMMIDPFYRTLRGFQVVVEKEWCALGHKFSLRYAHGGSSDKSEAAPVMAQWADCIWQMMRQFPTAFEINEFFLLELIEMVYVCKFGTFLFNTEGERRRAGVNKKTVSFWSVVNTKPDKYRNAHYKPYSGLIFPETSVRRLWVWEGLFFRDCTSLPPPEDSCPAVELEERLQAQGGQLQALAQTQSLELRCAQLQEQNLLLRKALNQAMLRERKGERMVEQQHAGERMGEQQQQEGKHASYASSLPTTPEDADSPGSWWGPHEGGWVTSHAHSRHGHAAAEAGAGCNGHGVVDAVAPNSQDSADSGSGYAMHHGMDDDMTGFLDHQVPLSRHSQLAVAAASQGRASGGRGLWGVAHVSAEAADDWHLSVHVRARSANVPSEVAEAMCDIIDCVAAQHGQRIHMHYTDPRRTSFPSRPFSSPNKGGGREAKSAELPALQPLLAAVPPAALSAALSANKGKQHTGEEGENGAAVEGGEDWQGEDSWSGDEDESGNAAGFSTEDFSTTDADGPLDDDALFLEGGRRGGGETSNPLQQPFASRDGGAASNRRRRDGYWIPGGMVQERALDETSANWIPDQGVSQCFKCKKAFDLFNRRHHCRSCGRIFCSGCSSHRSRLARGDSDKVRLCQRCFTYIQRLAPDIDT